MCLILFAWRVDPRYPLVVAANRDEFFDRPTAAAGFWPEAPTVLAGKDIEAGGTWMGVTTERRFSALTNFRDPSQMRSERPSRGKLVGDYLLGTDSPSGYLERSAALGRQCNGYNLLVGDRESLWWSSNVTEESKELAPGIYGVSNHLLDSPWPKVGAGRVAMENALKTLPDSRQLFELLTDATIHNDQLLPKTGIAIEWERMLSAAFIRIPSNLPTYGTRSSTVIVRQSDGTTHFDEITWGTDGFAPKVSARRRFRFSVG